MAPVDDGLQPPGFGWTDQKTPGTPLGFALAFTGEGPGGSRYLLLALVALGPMKSSRGGGTLLSDSVGNDPPVLARRGPQT